MGYKLDRRRRQILGKGRSMTLQRGASGATVTVCGFARAHGPKELVGGVVQGDLRVEILHDEIAAASWPAPPKKMDRLVADTGTLTVQWATPVHEGATVIGWSLWVLG